MTHEEMVVDTAPDWSYLAHLGASERLMLPESAATAHDPREPYDAELQPVRAPRVPRCEKPDSMHAQMRRDHESEE